MSADRDDKFYCEERKKKKRISCRLLVDLRISPWHTAEGSREKRFSDIFIFHNQTSTTSNDVNGWTCSKKCHSDQMFLHLIPIPCIEYMRLIPCAWCHSHAFYITVSFYWQAIVIGTANINDSHIHILHEQNSIGTIVSCYVNIALKDI